MMRLFTTLLLISVTGLAAAADPAPQQGIAIIGDRELPRVLYLVPWSSPTPPTPSAPLKAPDDTAAPDESTYELLQNWHRRARPLVAPKP